MEIDFGDEDDEDLVYRISGSELSMVETDLLAMGGTVLYQMLEQLFY